MYEKYLTPCSAHSNYTKNVSLPCPRLYQQIQTNLLKSIQRKKLVEQQMDFSLSSHAVMLKTV